MSETKHTKGPWRVGPINYADIYGKDCGAVALAIKGLPETVANARLISAAPELLQALKLWMEAFNSRMMSSDSKKAQKFRADMWDKAEAAIAKAEGRGA